MNVRELIEKLTALHERGHDDQLGVDCCYYCWDCANDAPTPWPCETMRIVEQHFQTIETAEELALHAARAVLGLSHLIVVDSDGRVFDNADHALDTWWEPGNECGTTSESMCFPVVVWSSGADQ